MLLSLLEIAAFTYDENEINKYVNEVHENLLDVFIISCVCSCVKRVGIFYTVW